VKRGDLVRFVWENTPAEDGTEELGILLNISQPKGLQKPIAKVHWFSMKHPLQHLTEALEVVSENR
jgi:hypothetical protein